MEIIFTLLGQKASINKKGFVNKKHELFFIFGTIVLVKQILQLYNIRYGIFRLRNKRRTMEEQKKIELLMTSVTGFNTAIRKKSSHQVPNMKPSEFIVIFHLATNGSLRPSALSKSMGLAPSSTTTIVDGLVEKGYVVRTLGVNDRRSFNLELTEKGDTFFKEERAQFFQGLHDLVECMSDEDFKQFIYYLQFAKAILDGEKERD